MLSRLARFSLVAVLGGACGRVGYSPTAIDGGADPSRVDGTPPMAILDGGTPGNDAFSGLANLVFVSSQTVLPGELGSVENADQFCTQLAEEAQLPGTFVAWLSTSTSNAIDRIGDAQGWVRPDGLPVIDTIADIDDRGMFHPIVVDELGTVRMAEQVATGTDASGAALAYACADLGDTSAETLINTGRNDTVAAGFTSGYISFAGCDVPLRLYCFGNDTRGSVSILPAEARFAFVSAAAFIPDAGLAAADELCRQEAIAAGLPGDYRALLGTDTATAASRFDLLGAPWMRPDGVLIAPTPEAALSGDLDSPITLTADGSYGGTQVWTGSGTGGSAMDPASATCDNWTVSTPARDGGSGVSWSVWLRNYFSSSEFTCSGSDRHLYCLQR